MRRKEVREAILQAIAFLEKELLLKSNFSGRIIFSKNEGGWAWVNARFDIVLPRGILWWKRPKALNFICHEVAHTFSEIEAEAYDKDPVEQQIEEDLAEALAQWVMRAAFHELPPYPLTALGQELYRLPAEKIRELLRRPRGRKKLLASWGVPLPQGEEKP